MKKIFFFFICILIGPLPAEIPMFSSPLSPRIANYDIDVRLDVSNKQLVATELLNWQNTTSDTIYNLQFHMYLNAFKNDQSTFMKESQGRRRGSNIERNKRRGWIEITHLEEIEGGDLTSKMSYIQPDDGNIFDETVLNVDLNRALYPGAKISLKIDFKAQLPKVFERTGYYNDFFMVGQWFPKLGVWENKNGVSGAWNCHQFHANSEFYADFGNYSVNITLPESFVTGATGILVGEINNGDGTKTMKYYCEDVHDFAWTADNDYTVITDQWKHVSIRYLCQPMREFNVQRYINSVKFAMSFLEDWVGPYPYPVLTIVDPQYGAMGSGGMEYPTIVTAGNHWLMPEATRFPEEVTVHEFAHNYFYGMLASNEFEEAWLDEGMTTYSEMKIMESYFPSETGSNLDMWDLKIDNTQYVWLLYASRPKKDKIYKRSWEYTRGGYGTFSYYKPALMLLTLENYLGQNKMKELWHEYYNRFSFKHPTTTDFIELVNDLAGQNMNWFLDPVIYGTDVLDYAIDKISSVPVDESKNGSFYDPSDISSDSIPSTSDRENDSTRFYESKVVVSREGELIFPVEIVMKFNDGEEIIENWNGRERYIVYTYTRPSGIISAEVDPERKIMLDINFLNNGMTLENGGLAVPKYGWRWFFWMQNLLQSLLIFS